MPTKDDTFLVTARQRFLTGTNANAENVKEAGIDREFKNLKQWPKNIETAREAEGRPCLIIDQIGEPLRQLCNQQRQARPSGQYSPIGNGADEDTAEVFQGIARHIEQDSESPAAQAYDWAFEEAAGFGLGWWRIRTELAGDGTADQKLIVEQVLNTDAVVRDPAGMKPNFSNIRYLFNIEDVPKDEYRLRWPDSDLTKLSNFRDVNQDVPDWFPEGCVRVAEYFYKEIDQIEMVQLSDGTAAEKTAPLPPGVTVFNTFTKPRTRVYWAMINGVEILEGNKDKTAGRLWPRDDRPSKYIPFVPVIGEKLFVKGQLILRGIYRAARDPQRIYNYERTALTEMNALAKAPMYIADADQIEPYRAIWEQSTTRNMRYLPYKAKSVDGHLVPRPEVDAISVPIEATVMGINLAKSDLRSTTGWFDATDPNRKNSEQSGRAILARQQSTQSGNAHYLDNYGQSMTYSYKILQHLAPGTYDRPGRVLRILGNDDKPREVMLNAPFKEGPNGQPQPVPPQDYQPDLHEFYKLDVGDYDVTVTIGQSPATRREEFSNFGLELMKVLPEQAPLIAPTVVENMDGAGHQQIAKILKKALPPQFQDHPEGEPDVQQLQQQIAQMGQIMEHLTGELKAKTQALETDAVKQQGQVEMKRIEADLQITLQRMKDATSIRVKEIDAEMKGLISGHAAAHEAQALHLEQQHEHIQNTLDREAQFALGEQGQQHALEQGEQAAALAPEPAGAGA